MIPQMLSAMPRWRHSSSGGCTMSAGFRSNWRAAPPVPAAENCPTCHGTGWETLRGSGPTIARRCSCRVQFNLMRLKDRVRIPQRYEHCTLDSFTPFNFSQVRALSEARRFAERFPEVDRGLFLAGGPGLGKTHLAVGIVRELLQRFQDDVLFVDFPMMLASLSATGNPEGVDWARLRRVSLLLLDNFGLASSTEPGTSIVEELLFGRLGRNLVTLFTGEKIRSRDLFGSHTDQNGSPTQQFLVSLSPCLALKLIARTKILSLVGEDYRSGMYAKHLF